MLKVNQQFERDLMGEFLLGMHLKLVLTAQNEWRLSKLALKIHFEEFIKQSKNCFFQKDSTLDVLLLLQRTKFLESQDEIFVIISVEQFNNYCKTIFKKYDNERKKKFQEEKKKEATIQDITADLASLTIHNFEETAEWTIAQYKGSLTQTFKTDFIAKKNGCLVCQKNYKSSQAFSSHVLHHNCKSEFEFIKKLKKLKDPVFRITYITKCNKLCIDIGLQRADIMIEKIILVTCDNLVCVPHENEKRFCLDMKFFTMNVEYPVIITFRNKLEKNKLFVEQYHLKVKETRRIRSSGKLKRVVKLKPYNVPTNFRKCGELLRNELLKTAPSVFNILSTDNYFSKLTVLLQIEEAHILKLYNTYTTKITLTQSTKGPIILKLTKSCNLLSIGDTAVFSKKPYKRKLYCVVEKYNGFEVEIKILDHKLLSEGSYILFFMPRRDNFVNQYFALDCLKSKNWFQNSYMFPKISYTQTVEPQSLELFNKSVGENLEQMEALNNIIFNVAKSTPYIIWGPPGTGKTTTLVEIIYQLFQRNKNTRILITANSNSACDTIALPLCQIFQKLNISNALLRLYTKSAADKANDRNVLLLSASNLDPEFYYPDMKEIHEYRIIVCTLSMIGRLNLTEFGQPKEYEFSHIFVDEAAAATEPETLCAFARLIKDPTRQSLVLAGDPKQLGPVIQSITAKDLGLGFSFMERLLKLDCYKSDVTGNYNHAIQTRLCSNFRSNAQIVRIYNHLYYDNLLIPKAPPRDVDMAKTWHRSLNTEYPILFHSVYGISNKDDESLVNALEAEYVLNYVQDLMYFGINNRKLLETDVGVISPYKKQGMEIKRLLNNCHWKDIEVGSVEVFQGKEKHIIIASFVRSFTSTLGFLEDAQRLNVLLSRAKSMLILIGNPYTLVKNKDFQFVIEQCRINKTIIEELVLTEPFDIDVLNKLLKILGTEECRLEEKQKLTEKESNENSVEKTEDKTGNDSKKEVLNAKQKRIIWSVNKKAQINKTKTEMG